MPADLIAITTLVLIFGNFKIFVKIQPTWMSSQVLNIILGYGRN